jgi:hypothetical protein
VNRLIAEPEHDAGGRPEVVLLIVQSAEKQLGACVKTGHQAIRGNRAFLQMRCSAIGFTRCPSLSWEFEI